jgi:hypothetical protein
VDGDPCTTNGDCCSSYCDGTAGACAPTCAGEGGDCVSDGDCCGTLVCGADGQCGAATGGDDGGSVACGAPGDPCDDNSECCSDECAADTLTCY